MGTLTTMNKRISELEFQTLARRLWRTHAPLTLLGFASLGLLFFAAAMTVLDPRVITGAPAWLKPVKFAISSIFYTLTLVWMLSFVEGRRRWVALVGWATAIALAVELILIVIQVGRGVRSHFNFTTPFDSAVFSTMAAFIMIIWAMSLVAAVLLLRQKMADRVLGWSLRLGLLVALIGAAVAFLMTGRPTPTQVAEIEAGQMPQYIGAHSVGVEDGGAGLPLVGWSTEGGDLRVPHFFGLHALQVIPITGFAVNRLFRSWLSERRRTGLVWTYGLGYLGLILLLTWQALRGQPVLAPDGLMLAALGLLVVAVAVASGWLLRR